MEGTDLPAGYKVWKREGNIICPDGPNFFISSPVRHLQVLNACALPPYLSYFNQNVLKQPLQGPPLSYNYFSLGVFCRAEGNDHFLCMPGNVSGYIAHKVIYFRSLLPAHNNQASWKQFQFTGQQRSSTKTIFSTENPFGGLKKTTDQPALWQELIPARGGMFPVTGRTISIRECDEPSAIAQKIGSSQGGWGSGGKFSNKQLGRSAARI